MLRKSNENTTHDVKSDRCLVVLKEAGAVYFKNQEYDIFSHLHFHNTVFNDYFEFHETVDVKTDAMQAESGWTFSGSSISQRYSAEYDMSLADLKKLINDTTTDWHGHTVPSKAKMENITKTLSEKLLGVYIDIKNPKTNGWERDREIPAPLLSSLCLVS